MKNLRLEKWKSGKVDECEFNVLTVFRATDLMFECGLTYTAASRKAERACVNNPDLLDMSLSIPKDRSVPQG